MLGGYQIINLSNIDLTIGTSQVSITDKDVLAQLRELREHIEDNYNFIVPLNRKLKPVLLRLRDKKNGEKQEVSVWANLSIITNNKTFKIEALVDSVSMKAIQIEVVFQQLTDDDGNPYWDIKTAKYLYTENIGIEGDLDVTGSVNGEEDPSVKPIYYHPISINSEPTESTLECRIQLVIFDNSSTPYDRTTLLAKLVELMDGGALININGYFRTNNSVVFNAYIIQKVSAEYRVYGNSTTGRDYIVLDSILHGSTQTADGVNKIN